MQHRFLPIFSNFVTIAGCTAVLSFMAILLFGCAAQQEAAAETPITTAAPTPTPTAAPSPTPYRDMLEGITVDTPIEEHPFYLAPEPTVRADAEPPLTAPPASEEREADITHTDGNYSYIRYDDGTAGLIGCRFAEATHVFDLPETVDGLPVTGLEPSLAYAFEPATKHTPRNDIIIRIPKGVRYIGCNIAEAEMLHDITVEFSPDNPYFQAVGNSIFSADGTLLHSYQSDPAMMHPQVYIIPETVTDIGQGAFYHCQELIHVQFPAGLRTIGAHAFDGCENLSILSLPASLETVGEEAFAGFLMTLEVLGDATDLGTEPALDSVAAIYCSKSAAAADYAAQHDIPCRDEAAPALRIAIDPAARHLLSYALLPDGTAKLLRIDWGLLRDYPLPETVDGIPVTALGHETLLYINERHEDYPSVIHVPECITQIDAGALWPETIMGAAGSAAETFAAEEWIEFIAE